MLYFSRLSRFSPYTLSLLRLMSGLLFLEHGLTKIFGVPFRDKFFVTNLSSLEGAAGLIELIGGTLLTLGLLTQPVAFLLSGEMAIAYFTVHAPQNFYPGLNGGELAILYCFLFLHLSTVGGGPWSMDALIARRRTARSLEA